MGFITARTVVKKFEYGETIAINVAHIVSITSVRCCDGISDEGFVCKDFSDCFGCNHTLSSVTLSNGTTLELIEDAETLLNKIRSENNG